MTEEQKLIVTDIERKAIAFCKEKEITLPIANYLVEFATEATKELQEELEKKDGDFRKFKADYQELCLLKDMRIDDKDKLITELEKQIEKMKSDVKEIDELKNVNAHNKLKKKKRWGFYSMLGE